MSHWTRSKVKVNRPELIKKVAEDMGLKVKEDKDLKSYAGTERVDMLISGHGGKAGLKRNVDGSHTMIIDNWNNPLTEIVGHDCSLLMRGYTTALVEEEAMMMGAVTTETSVRQDNFVEVDITVM